jgi:hypothetical protein
VKVYKVLVGKRKKKEHLEHFYLGRKVIKREMGWEDMDWFHVAQDKDMWQAVVNTVLNVLVL